MKFAGYIDVLLRPLGRRKSWFSNPLQRVRLRRPRDLLSRTIILVLIASICWWWNSALDKLRLIPGKAALTSVAITMKPGSSVELGWQDLG